MEGGGALPVDLTRIPVHSLLREFSVCHVYTSVMFSVLSLSKLFVQNIKLFEEINKKYITPVDLRGYVSF